MRGDLGPHDVARLNLETVSDVLDAAGVPYLLVRDPEVRHRIAVRRERRADALAAIARALADAPVYAEPIGRGAPPGGHARDVTGWPDHDIRLYRPVTQPSEALRFAADCGCDLEFWESTPAGGLRATRPTLVGRDIPASALEPAELAVGGRRHPSLAVFTQTFTDEPDFPVDAVYTWVDGADPAWRERRAAALGERVPHPADGGESRYRSRDELRYSLRSLAMYAPWVRRIWIVTDRQVPAWLNIGHPRIAVVDHRDVFTDADALPTYNSHAIETQLHHIDGLSEHFLYLNDDFFLGRPLTPGRFFHPAGLTRCFPSPTAIPQGPRDDRDPTWIAAAKNNRELIRRAFGRGTVHAFKHAPYALRRSVLDELERRFAAEFAATARSRIRSGRDLSVVSSLYHHYGLCTGQAVAGELSADTVPLSRGSGLPTLARLLEARDREVFCLNDMASGDLTEEQKDEAAAGFLERYFPVTAPWEAAGPDRT
ncbi:Exopolysaccharide phosphotransferase CpsY [Actinomadura sp. RB68]|uniref:Exopolysaccharide phosphotransferase CpsY n=1 Tax=Actinomadura macrotermitis TaxID=2585200 RepID=A0A7K0C254_9ACTN|nr:Exopolysaccharide phosphotransferase CpsY [Actinomadura macrotermitis]